MIDLERFWCGEIAWIEDQSPASAEAVRAWEDTHGVRLPRTLALALALQNGGFVRDTDLTIHPLSHIQPITEISLDPDAPEQEHIHFGVDEWTGCALCPDYSAGPEPWILEVGHMRTMHFRRREGVRSFDELVIDMRTCGCRTRPREN